VTRAARSPGPWIRAGKAGMRGIGYDKGMVVDDVPDAGADDSVLRPLPFDQLHPELRAVLESAAELQRRVPDTVLVGGSATALHAEHRASYDHDHVLSDLRDRFDVVLDALESYPDWVTNRARAQKIILGELGDIESGVRQLLRTRPLEVERVDLEGGRTLTVPTFDETVLVKAFLITTRNQVRDFLDVAAFSDRCGVPHAASVLADIDGYYTDETRDGRVVESQLIRQLGRPDPKDRKVIGHLAQYKGLKTRWADWNEVVEVCQGLSDTMVKLEEGRSS
jgi:hypothetical protein